MEERFIVEERTRMGFCLLSIHDRDSVLGSIYLDPEKYVGQIESIKQLIRRWNEDDAKEVERERVRSNERNSRRNGSSLEDG